MILKDNVLYMYVFQNKTKKWGNKEKLHLIEIIYYKEKSKFENCHGQIYKF